MGIFIIIFIIIMVPILTYSNYKNEKHTKKIQQLNNSRPYLTKTEYIKILADKGYPKKEIEVVYDEIKKMLNLKYFSIYPEDCIYEVYRMHDLDDIDLFDTISKKLGLKKFDRKDCDLINNDFEKVNAEYILTLMNNLKVKL